MSNFTTKPKNPIALSFDVEDWFTVRNMRGLVSDDQWHAQESRIHVGVNFILEELSKKNIKATFFILGWLADNHPEIVKSISDQGHEIACHGYQHTPIDLLTPQSFKQDLSKSITSLERVTGKKIKGFRAPSFSVTEKTAWALPIMKECGLEYDSSIFVTSHPDYGVQDFPTVQTAVGGMTELPLKKSPLFGTQIPVCGGGYFRMLPYALTKAALKKDLQKSPAIMYFHPWEFDPGQPRMALPPLKRFRHYVGLNSNRGKFIQLLNDFEFTTMENLLTLNQSQGVASYSFANTEALVSI
ncbi:XrtA system polysaccharide deacetylase [Bdellovibrio bacteriovorus]